MNEAVRTVIGIDVGGANLKFATTDGQAWSVAFPMWLRPAALRDALTQQLKSHPSAKGCAALAVTMTGELADCFRDRGVGVRHIVQQTVQAADRCGIATTAFYGVDGRFHRSDQAADRVDEIAAANWHALANYIATNVVRDGLLIDIGSTTSDLIPLADGRVATEAKTDFDRLKEGSLVYVGCRRTPVCALVDTLPCRHGDIPVMNEVFATIDDAMLLLHRCSEVETETDTADGQPRTVDHARNRLARMIGLDHRQVTLPDAQRMAHAVLHAARQRIDTARSRLKATGPVILSGHGEGLLSDDLSISGASSSTGPHDSVIRLADRLSADAVRCAPSFAAAKLYEVNHYGPDLA